MKKSGLIQEMVITHIKDQGRSVLEIRGETNTSDAGTYTAVAVNKAGKAESVGEIQIYSKLKKKLCISISGRIPLAPVGLPKKFLNDEYGNF